MSTLRLDSRELAKRIRLHALRMTSLGGGSHIGAIFSWRLRGLQVARSTTGRFGCRNPIGVPLDERRVRDGPRREAEYTARTGGETEQCDIRPW